MNEVLAGVVIDALVARGVRDIVFAPGSRSTPLVFAAQRLRCHILHDERSAAFFALGIARASETPVPVVTTSGTAVANLLPALVEAHKDGIPLVALSADRPMAHVGSGANQTIDQRALLRGAVHTMLDFEDTSEPQRIYQRVLSSTLPAHINLRFHKPLEPTGVRYNIRPASFDVGELAPSDEAIERARAFVEGAHSGVVVVGRLARKRDIEAAQDIVSALGWPVITSALSGLRTKPQSVPHLDDVCGTLGSARFRRAFLPDAVLHLGGPIVSATLPIHLQYVPTLFVGDGASADALDRPADTIRTSLTRAKAEIFTSASSSNIAGLFRRVADIHIDTPLSAEAALARRLSTEVEGAFFVGNSTPIRDVDRFALRSAAGPRIYCNRGASGIDGSLSTAAGIGCIAATTALVGDITMLHDAGALATLPPFRLIVVDNNGGSLFHRLPIAAHDTVFERFFRTPHGRDVDAIASAYGTSIERFVTSAHIEVEERRRYDHALSAAIDEAL